MLICIPDVLSKDDVADFRRIMAADGGGAIGGGEEERTAAARRQDVPTARRAHSPCALHQHAFHFGRSSASCLSAPLQSLRTWAILRRARRQLYPGRSPYRPAHPHR